MSDISLYSGLYETIRRWADLIDDAIVNIKLNNSDVEHPSYPKLNDLFTTLAEPSDKQDFSDERLASIIENELKTKIPWSQLSRDIDDPGNRAKILPTLELIAECLGKKHADTVAKMRWGHM